jgi:hypothetical protein
MAELQCTPRPCLPEVRGPCGFYYVEQGESLLFHVPSPDQLQPER